MNIEKNRYLLHQTRFSLNHEEFARSLAEIENILIVQDLDGVCMGLVKDPLDRIISKEYIEATKSFQGHFYVLTNGEHLGERGVNGIIERTFQNSRKVKEEGLLLPGLAAGGIQWQDNHGNISHLGVSEEELSFLAEIPRKIETRLKYFFTQYPDILSRSELLKWIQASVLKNKVSPTANLNTFYERLGDRSDIYISLQQAMQNLMGELLIEAKEKDLENSFFVHYAPNLGKDDRGNEILWEASDLHSGTTDFQFMLLGAVKEAGVVVILNQYYYYRSGKYPLGKDFNIREAVKQGKDLLSLVKNNFAAEIMPTIVGVGDTVTSVAENTVEAIEFKRGGSDRNFLQLIQDLGIEFDTGNIIAYVDSSRGEVKNRKSIKLGKFINNEGENPTEEFKVIKGPTDERDLEDPLKLNIVFPEGHQQYIHFFSQAARMRRGFI